MHRLFDAKFEQQGCAEERESETKLMIALNARKSDHVIHGLRIKINGSDRQGQIKLKLLEREAITVSQGDQYWYDLPMSDVEVMYASQN